MHVYAVLKPWSVVVRGTGHEQVRVAMSEEIQAEEACTVRVACIPTHDRLTIQNKPCGPHSDHAPIASPCACGCLVDSQQCFRAGLLLQVLAAHALQAALMRQRPPCMTQRGVHAVHGRPSRTWLLEDFSDGAFGDRLAHLRHLDVEILPNGQRSADATNR
eukprot:351815-Chlamydomonas_euryale.AAC.2